MTSGIQVQWAEVQAYHNDGHSRDECIEHFGFALSTWYMGARQGRLKTHIQKPRELFPLDEILARGNRKSIKRRLIYDGVLIERCDLCGMGPVWQGKPLVLRLDHINGVNNDNTLTNLRLVCPNCDSQLPTYAGRNRKRA